MTRSIQAVGVCGAGAMGSGIAQVAAQARASVVVFDTQPTALDAGRKRVDTAMATLVNRGKLDEADANAVASRIKWTQNLGDLAEADLAIEAIIERQDIKASLFRELEAVLDEQAIIASNTSSLSISKLAATLGRPERFIGMHFFNPAPAMKLVEVVAGMQTRPDIVEAVTAAATAWGKAAVPVADVPGFIVNRVARPFYGEAFRALGEKAAPPQLIDHLFRSCAGFRMGPLELTDLIGQDVNCAVASSIYAAYAGRTRFTPEPAQRSLVDEGRLGRKSGAGVYRYADGADERHKVPPAQPIDREAPAVIKERKAAFEHLLACLYGRAPRGFVAIGDVLVGFGQGRSAMSEAAEAGRDVAVFDWTDDTAGAPLAFAASSAAAAHAAVTLAAGVGRDAYRIGDRPGLIVLRTLAQLANAACDAAQEHVADEGSIDAAMRFGANYPYGLFDWADRYGRARLSECLANIANGTGDAMYWPSDYLKGPA